MGNELDVLVVGAGPTGLVMSGELLRRGLRVRVIDKADAPTRRSKAVGVHARTLEIFDDLGIADDLVARGLRLTGATMSHRDQLLVDVQFGGLPTRFPFILCVSQVETESVLTALLDRRGGTVERNHELVSLTQDDACVEAVVRGEGGDHQIRASYVIGCDGAHSGVRHALGATFEGHAYEETFLLADVHIDWDEPRTHVSTFFAEDGVAALFPMKSIPDPARPNCHRWRVIVTAAASLGDAPALDEVRMLVEQRIGKSVPMSDAAWITPFRIHCRQVEHYRHGRAFLAGDAAHIHSPIGGQGMNTGIQDAHNLAWKLALVVKGTARPELLDSYHVERHAIGKAVLKQTDLVTKMGLVKGLLVPLRNQAARLVTSFDFVRTQIVRDASELSIAYRGSPIVGEHTSSTFAARVGKPESGETPTVHSRIAFAAGPQPGARAPDGMVTVTHGTGRPARLAEVCSGDAFTLLLFDGRSTSDQGYDTLVEIAQHVRDRWGDLVRVYLVTPRGERPTKIPSDISVLLDAGELEARYGAQTECLYLVRPDLYIGFRSQPADGKALGAHLASILF